MSMRYPGGLIASSPVNAAYPSGVWTQAQTQPYAAQNVWMRDQFWPNTTLLLQGNGTNGAQNNTFLDSSTNNFTITRNGNTTQGSFTPYEANGYWSNYFDGSGDSLTLSSNAAFAPGTGDFTVEAWIFPTAAWGTWDGVFVVDVTGGIFFGKLDTGFGLRAYATANIVSTTAPEINKWTHVAVSRSGTTVRLFIDGALAASATSSQNFGQGTAYIGNSPSAGEDFPGYISNLRLVKGTAVYTSAFTPSAAPLTAITNTSLLTCQSNRFIDNSTNAFAITRNGDTSVQAFQPFPGATTWSGSVLGGSGYFDGSGDYLSIPDNAAFDLGSGAFTLEAWINMADVTPSKAEWIISQWLSDTGNSWGFRVETDGTLNFFYSTDGNNATTVGTASPGLVANTWQHIAVVRSGNTVTIYVDGVSKASATVTATFFNSSASVMIGNQAATGFGQTFTGYIASARVVKGTAVYTSTFTPPTAPLTAITNTSLLCNFTNAGIFDSAMMNNLETVGNAQVSTSVVKYGTGSMAFDGSGDWLTIPYSQNINFGTGNFTIEGWFYLSSFANQYYVLGGTWTTGSSDEWLVQIENNGTMRFLTSAGTSFYTAGITTGTWYHFAAVRNGSTVTLYVNGSSVGSYTNSNSIGSTSKTLYIGVQNNGAAWPWNGYIDDLRITKGAARYIGNFTPPVARMPQQ